MSAALKENDSRAPRYTLNPEDDKLLLFSADPSANEVYHTEIIDISASGLAFATHTNNTPDVNEIINMEFTIPGGRRMAWQGRVVRIDPLPQTRKWKKCVQSSKNLSEVLIVGVRFEKLPSDHKYYLNSSIKTRLQSLQKHKEQERLNIIYSLLTSNKLKTLAYLACVVGVAASLIFLAMPESHLGQEENLSSQAPTSNP